MYGYSTLVVPWLFQIDDETPEASSVLPDLPCRVIKDLQGLPNGNHRVIVTPQSIGFVLTKFKYVSFDSSSVLLFIYSLSVTGNALSGSTPRTNTTLDSRAFSLDGGNQVAQVLFLVLLVYFSMALSSL